jgi:hypothetical protein
MRVNVDGSPINDAVSAAKQLQTHLSQAMNANTGRLDMTAFNTSLQKAGTNLT